MIATIYTSDEYGPRRPIRERWANRGARRRMRRLCRTTAYSVQLRGRDGRWLGGAVGHDFGYATARDARCGTKTRIYDGPTGSVRIGRSG